MANTKLIKICLPTVEEARNRATVLALLTADYRKSSNSFMRMFMKEDFIGSKNSRVTYQYIRNFFLERNIKDETVDSYLAPAGMTET